jgi:hypothetical protein
MTEVLWRVAKTDPLEITDNDKITKVNISEINQALNKARINISY